MRIAHEKRGMAIWLGAVVWGALAAVVLPGTAGARVWRVPAQFIPTIQDAATLAAANDTILVSPGTYLETVSVGAKWLTFLSVAGRDATVIDAQGAGNVLSLKGGGNVIGFTLQNGNTSSWGGGIYLRAPTTETRSCTIQGNRVQNCRGRNGGGIAVDYVKQVNIMGCEISDNEASVDGGGIYCEPAGVIEGNVISGNIAFDSGGGIFTGATVQSNVVAGNHAHNRGGGIHAMTSAKVSGNTVIGNSGSNGGSAVFFDHPYATGEISRNIFAFNGTGTTRKAVQCFLGTAPRIECNDFWGNKNGDLFCEEVACDTTGLGNFASDPKFCDATSGDYRLQEGSPCAPTSGSGCGQVGALAVACGGTPVVPMTWGRLKSLYKDRGLE